MVFRNPAGDFSWNPGERRGSTRKCSPYDQRRLTMAKLAKLAIDAHGGLDTWRRFSTVSVHGINGGMLWAAKGKPTTLADVTITADLHTERVSHWPFGTPDRRSRFEPQRVALEDANGEVIEE